MLRSSIVSCPNCGAAGIDIVSYGETTPEEHRALDKFYDERVFPVLTPLAVDPGHPFPYISDLALSLAVTVADPETGDRRFARLKVPNVFPRLVRVSPGRYLPVEQLIAARLDRLFVGMVIEEWAPFRVSRNADLTLEEEEADDLLEAVEMELRRRRFKRAVRLEVAHDVSEDLLGLLVRELELTPADVTFHRSPIDLSFLWELLELERPDLKDRAVAAGHRRPHRRGGGRRTGPIFAWSATAPCSSITRTRASPRASRRSSARPPTIRGCSRSR